MTTRHIPLDQATPGMVLAEAVRLSDSKALLPQATRLTDRHLASLKQRGVKQIAIMAEEAAEGSSAAERQARQEAARLQIQRLFRHAATDATTQALLRTVLEYRQETTQ